VFTGLFFGPVSAAAYLLLRRWLPAGRAGGLAFGTLLLVVAGTRLEPLRRSTPTSTWSARAGSRWSPSRCWWCSTAYWLPP
jgi:hypothetical protein